MSSVLIMLSLKCVCGIQKKTFSRDLAIQELWREISPRKINLGVINTDTIIKVIE